MNQRRHWVLRKWKFCTIPFVLAQVAAWVLSMSAIVCPKFCRWQTVLPFCAMDAVRAHLKRQGMVEDELVSLMIGRSFQSAFPPKSDENAESESVLMLTGFRVRCLVPINLTVRRGEILGLGWRGGQRTRRVFPVFVGSDPPKAGLVMCNGKELTLITPSDAINAGILLLAGDRKRESLFPVLGREK